MRCRVTISPGRHVDFDDGLLAARAPGVALGAGERPARLAFAATRIVLRDDYAASTHAPDRPGRPEEIAAAIDWERTIALRRRLDDLGFGIAEAMDTAQRFRLGWGVARSLIEATGRAGLARPFVAGAGVDQLEGQARLAQLAPAVLEQARHIRAAGGIPIVLPLLPLARERASEEQYVAVYEEIVRASEGPLLLHWLGPAFHAELEGYFPGRSLERILALDPEKVVGLKLSLLDSGLELELRRRLLPRGQVVFTGDDYHFQELLLGGTPPSDRAPPIEGWRQLAGQPLALGDFSHALLGVLDAIALPASRALACLQAGDVRTYRALLEPCERLGRALFEPPTSAYKAGLAWLARLEGLQTNAMLVDHEERLRPREHYLRVTELAAEAGLFTDAGATAERFEDCLRRSPA